MLIMDRADADRLVRSIKRVCNKCGGDFNDAITTLEYNGKLTIVKCKHCEFRTYVRTPVIKIIT